jgi:hypothetical protein
MWGFEFTTKAATLLRIQQNLRPRLNGNSVIYVLVVVVLAASRPPAPRYLRVFDA